MPVPLFISGVTNTTEERCIAKVTRVYMLYGVNHVYTVYGMVLIGGVHSIPRVERYK